MSTVATLVYPGCTIAEILETVTRLRLTNCEVCFVGVDTQPFRDTTGLTIAADLAIHDLDATNVQGLIVPGGDPEAIMGNEQVRRLVSGVAASALVAGICAGVLVLADAGVLTGRRITHNYRAPWVPREIEAFVAPLLSDAIVETDCSIGVVQDGNLITALPNAAVDFALTVCEALHVIRPEQAALLARHLRGDYVQELFDNV